MSRKYQMKFPRFLIVVLLSLIGFTVFYFKIGNSVPCANSNCEESTRLSVNNDEIAIFNGEKITPPQIEISEISGETSVLGAETSTDEKHIYVDLSSQTLKAFEGNELFMEAKVSTGKWFPTPTGDFKIWTKVRATKMSGGQGADYYYLPNVPFVMFFSNSKVPAYKGFSLHGAYWHNNFGHAMSHGCVNMRTIDAQKLFYWANSQTTNSEGTLITIYGKAS